MEQEESSSSCLLTYFVEPETRHTGPVETLQILGGTKKR